MPVKYQSPTTAESRQQAGEYRSEGTQFELIRPHFLVRVALSEADSKRFHAGQPALVSFRATRGSIGEVISELVTSWLRDLRGKTT